MYQRPIIPITQLINPIRTPYQNKHTRPRQKSTKNLKPPLQLPCPLRSVQIPPRILQNKADEDAQGEDLEGEARDGDVDGGFGTAGGGA